MTGGLLGVHVRLLRQANPGVALLWKAARLSLVVVALSGARYAAARPAAHAHRAAPGSEGWSAPRTLASGCELAGGPRVAFPSEAPNLATGPGAIVWPIEAGRCGKGAGGAGGPLASAVTVAAVGASDEAAARSTVSLPGSLQGAPAVVGGTLGRVAVAAALAPPRSSAAGTVAALQDRATRPPAAPSLLMHGQAPSLARAYLGDVAIAAVVPGPAIEVRVDRHYDAGFGAPRRFPIAVGAVTALTATMDFRSDVLLAWQQNGAIHARMLRASGRTDPEQRLGASSAEPQIRALVSDNDHGMVAWSSTDFPASSSPATHLYIDLSAAGVRFQAPRLVASFPDPAGVGRSAGSLALERLSTENVVMAWTDAEHGHYVVRSAPAVFAASRPATRLSDAHSQSVLADLASGAAGEAIALWRSGGRGAGGGEPSRLWAARTYVVPHDHVGLRPPQMIAAGPVAAASVAVDPASDRAVAAWLSAGAPRRIEYAVSGRGGAVRPRARPPTAAITRAGAGTHWLRITGAAVVAAAVLAALLAWRRRRQAAGR